MIVLVLVGAAVAVDGPLAEPVACEWDLEGWLLVRFPEERCCLDDFFLFGMLFATTCRGE